MGLVVLPYAILVALISGANCETYVSVIEEQPSIAAVGTPELIDPNNGATDKRVALRYITTTFYNNDDFDMPFVVFLEIRDSYGVTVYLVFHTGVLAGNGKTELGSSWLPQETGDYELRAFAISNFTKPVVIAQVKSTNASVTL